MGRGILKRLANSLGQVAARLPDTRRPGNDTKYELQDALKSALSVFYLLHPSLLDFQRAMEKKHRRSNLETLFGVKEIPSSNQMKTLLDDIEPGGLDCVFDEGLRISKLEGVYSKQKVLGGLMPLAVDGTWYFSSKEIHCEHCLTQTRKNKDGEEETLYYHDALTVAIVHYNSSVVLPLAPEFIRNEDGMDKQDCEINAFKRYLERRKEQLKLLNPVFLGDDLYSCHSICSKIDEMGMRFLFTCKDTSHRWIVEQTEGAPFEEYKRVEWDGKNHEFA
ncbi:MAG: hypothetical protein LBM77_06145 [Spirochaetaceae bacterium]|jgi:hypothetical protein|nr:hypothetical protein [Spirochaetaceae bacterium]